MNHYENGGLKNQLAPRNNNPRLNKMLLIINCILCICALVIGAVHLYYNELTIAIAMLLVSIFCIYNAVLAWKALRKRKI